MYSSVCEVKFEVIIYSRQVSRVGRPDEYCCKLLYAQSLDKVKIKITNPTLVHSMVVVNRFESVNL